MYAHLWQENRALMHCIFLEARTSTCARQLLSDSIGWPRSVKSCLMRGLFSLYNGMSAARKVSTSLDLKSFLEGLDGWLLVICICKLFGVLWRCTMAFHPEALVTVDSGAAELAEEFTIRVDTELAWEFSRIETSFVAFTHAHLRHLGLKFVWIVLFCLYNGQRQVRMFVRVCLHHRIAKRTSTNIPVPYLTNIYPRLFLAAYKICFINL